MTDSKSLINRRKTLKGNLTRAKTFVTSIEKYLAENGVITQSMKAEALQRKLRCEPCLDEFESIQSQIEQEEQELDEEAADAVRESFENSYYEVLTKLSEFSKDVEETSNKSNHRSQSNNGSIPAEGIFDDEIGPTRITNNSRVKLPQITIPTFSGEIEQWLNFRDMFQSLIHARGDIAEIEKFQYLKAALSGDAAAVIRAIPLSTANYGIAWETLKRRFENKPQIINNHLKAIFEIECIPRESYVLLQSLLNTILTNISSLKVLDQPTEHWDSILIYLIRTKLDTVTKRDWEKVRSEMIELPTLEDMITFLTKKCQLLESLHMNTTLKRQPVSDKTEKVKSAHVAIQSFECKVCKGNHAIYRCPTFLEMTPGKRIAEAVKHNLCKNCLKHNHKAKDCKSSTCRQCNQLHNTLLHLERVQSTTMTSPSRAASQTNDDCTASHNVSCMIIAKQSFLPTALVYVTDIHGHKHEARVLLDSGSQVNLVRRDLLEKLGIKSRPHRMTIAGINDSASQSLGMASLNVYSRVNSYKCKAACIILEKITSETPRPSINVEQLNIPKTIQLADPSFSQLGRIDVLIGVEIFWSLMCTDQISLGRSQPILQNTLLGWVVSGSMSSAVQCKSSASFITIADPCGEIDKQLAALWQIQEIPENAILTVEEHECEKLFTQTTERNTEGRFVVQLPFKENVGELGASFNIACRRFKNLERRIFTDVAFHKQYSQVIQEYVELGHATEVNYNDSEIRRACFLPHHAVVRPDKTTTRLRVVFDASSKTESGLSLNDVLMVGPVVQSDLFAILMQFRLHRYAAIGDCEKMYRQILVRPSDRIYQNVVWRNTASSDFKILQLNTVSFGTSAAPYLATRCIHQIALDNANLYPETCDYIKNSFYVDDFIASFESEEIAKRTLAQLNDLLLSYGFPMRKWASNHPQVLDVVSAGESRIQVGNDSTSCRTLGLDWETTEDIFQFPVNIDGNPNPKITKRGMLSVISSVFDPLGLIGPIIVKAKIMLQRLWQLKISWDDTVPMELHTTWCLYLLELAKIPMITIPRQVLCNEPVVIQIHAFSDASEIAYGTCIFLRSTDLSGHNTVNLLCSKGRVAPLKVMTIPRLELMAAQLSTKLVTKVKSSLRVKIHQTFRWCDSSIVLAWLKKHPSELKTFVAHRVADIMSQSEDFEWHHVRSGENPADLLSRGTSTESLSSSSLWWHGPAWLSQDSELWPVTTSQHEAIELPDVKMSTVALTTSIKETEYIITNLITRTSSLLKLQRVLAYVVRFKNMLQHILPPSKTLTVPELAHSLQFIIKQVQLDTFADEVSSLAAKKTLSPSNRLVALNPFLDDNGVLRVGGRIRQSNLSYHAKFPIILPKKHPFTDLVIRYYHEENLHAGAHSTLNASRQAYWILGGKRTIARITSSCVRCRRFNVRPPEPKMGDLPKDRVTPSRPFSICGTDFAGPFLIRSTTGRGSRTTKAYLCLFICFATTAVHLELVTSLTTEAFIACLKRFIARRGLCKVIYSDNGTNYVGASNYLKEVREFLSHDSNTDYITDYLTTHSVTWKFIPARSPHFGGLWESAIKSAKRHLYKIAGDRSFTYEELTTLFHQIESVMNSRPLLPVPSQPNDIPFLTPGHFLIGDTLQALPEPNMIETNHNSLSRFHIIQKLHQQFWRVWSKDYLNLLQVRSKWNATTSTPMKMGDIVLLKEPVPPLLWRMGRITKIHPGQDGVVRVITVRVGNSEVKRAVAKIVLLMSD